MSFNRPQFLRPVLESLKSQRDEALAGREVHLFQDGAVNRYSGIRYAKDADIAESVETFKGFFPDGVVHHAGANVGIFENFRRAERYLFEERDFDVGYFFEDDLILSPVYIRMLDRLCEWALARSDVAYFAAYGDYYAVPDEIKARQRDLMTLDHHWAFGLLRKHWRKMQPLLGPYYEIVEDSDYTRRDHRKIFGLYDSLDACPRASSQDAAKAFACDRLGLWRANTVVPFARYIGNVGQHMTPEQFRAIGFERTVIANEVIGNLRFPDSAMVDKHLKDQRGLFSEIKHSEVKKIIAGLPPHEYNPLRLCDRSDVVYGYRLLLNREPTEKEIAVQLERGESVVQFIRRVTESGEFRESSIDPNSRLCDRDGVIYAYRLFLHRDPENEDIIKRHVESTSAAVLARAIWQDKAREKLWSSIQRS